MSIERDNCILAAYPCKTEASENNEGSPLDIMNRRGRDLHLNDYRDQQAPLLGVKDKVKRTDTHPVDKASKGLASSTNMGSCDFTRVKPVIPVSDHLILHTQLTMAQVDIQCPRRAGR